MNLQAESDFFRFESRYTKISWYIWMTTATFEINFPIPFERSNQYIQIN